MTISHKLVLFIGLIDIATCSNAYNDFFDEELMLKPLSSDHVYAYFQFTIIWETENRVETREYTRIITGVLHPEA